MKKTAVLLDLGFALVKLYPLLGNRNPTAVEVIEFAKRCIAGDEELFRIYCYHCLPYDGTQTHPLTKAHINFATTPMFKAMRALIQDLKASDHVAVRLGELSFDGWRIKAYSAKQIVKTGRALIASDFVPDLKQKAVDIKIGLDVAWLSSKSIIERIILVTADSDFIPAMKFARREGVQVILVTLGHNLLKQEMREHSDELRAVTYP